VTPTPSNLELKRVPLRKGVTRNPYALTLCGMPSRGLYPDRADYHRAEGFYGPGQGWPKILGPVPASNRGGNCAGGSPEDSAPWIPTVGPIGRFESGPGACQQGSAAVARVAHNHEVAGSIPAPAISLFLAKPSTATAGGQPTAPAGLTTACGGILLRTTRFMTTGFPHRGVAKNPGKRVLNDESDAEPESAGHCRLARPPASGDHGRSLPYKTHHHNSGLCVAATRACGQRLQPPGAEWVLTRSRSVPAPR
jgi:hypothetical protein